MVAPVPAQISKLPRRNLPCPSRRSSPNSRPVNVLQPLGSLFPTPVLCFQQLAASFPKTPGWGVPLRNLCDLCVSALSFVFALVRSSWRFLCPPLTTFRINTCKSVSKQRTLTPFRMNTYEKPGGVRLQTAGLESQAAPVLCATWRLYPLCPHSIAHTSRHHGGVPLVRTNLFKRGPRYSFPCAGRKTARRSAPLPHQPPMRPSPLPAAARVRSAPNGIRQ